MFEDSRAVSRLVKASFDEDLVIETIRECRERLGADPSLAVAFVSPDWSAHLPKFLECLQVDGRAAQVVGCSAGGLIGSGEEDENVSGFSLLMLYLPHSNVEIREFSEEQLEETESPAAWEKLTGVPAGPGGGGWIALGHPLRIRSEDWLRRWNAVYGHVPIFGGLASGSQIEDDLFLFRESGRSEAAMLGIYLGGGIKLGGVVSQGCRPIGEPYTITEVDDNVLVTVGQRRAFDVLEEAFESLGEHDQENARGNIFAGLAMSEYVDDFRQGDFLVRNILGGDPQAGVIAVGALPRVGQTLQFQLRDRQSAGADLRHRCRALQSAAGTPFAGLLFSCAGRGVHLFGRPNHDAGTVEDVFGRVPLSGFFGNGEFGPVGGKNFIHGYTASVVFLFHA